MGLHVEVTAEGRGGAKPGALHHAALGGGSRVAVAWATQAGLVLLLRVGIDGAWWHTYRQHTMSGGATVCQWWNHIQFIFVCVTNITKAPSAARNPIIKLVEEHLRHIQATRAGRKIKQSFSDGWDAAFCLRSSLTITHLALHHWRGGHAVVEVACCVATRTHGHVGSWRLRKTSRASFFYVYVN